MATVAAVVDRAANDLGLLRLGQSLQSQDATRITSAYNEVFAQLKKEGIASWASTGTIPDEITPFLAVLMAHNCLNTYAVSDSRYKRIMQDATAATREIRKFTTQAYATLDEPTDY